MKASNDSLPFAAPNDAFHGKIIKWLIRISKQLWQSATLKYGVRMVISSRSPDKMVWTTWCGQNGRPTDIMILTKW